MISPGTKSMRGRNAGLTDAQRPIAGFQHADGYAVVIHAWRHRVNAREPVEVVAAVVIVVISSCDASALAAAAREDDGNTRPNDGHVVSREKIRPSVELKRAAHVYLTLASLVHGYSVTATIIERR